MLALLNPLSRESKTLTALTAAMPKMFGMLVPSIGASSGSLLLEVLRGTTPPPPAMGAMAEYLFTATSNEEMMNGIIPMLKHWVESKQITDKDLVALVNAAVPLIGVDPVETFEQLPVVVNKIAARILEVKEGVRVVAVHQCQYCSQIQAVTTG